MLLQDHLQGIKARAEDGDAQGAQDGLPGLIGGHIEQSRDEIASDIEELLLVEAGINQVMEDLQGTVHRTGGAGGVVDDLKQRREKLRPLVGEIGAGDLTDSITGGGLDLALGDISGCRQLEQRAADLGFVGIVDEDLAAELVETRGPGADDEGAQDREG